MPQEITERIAASSSNTNRPLITTRRRYCITSTSAWLYCFPVSWPCHTQWIINRSITTRAATFKKYVAAIPAGAERELLWEEIMVAHTGFAANYPKGLFCLQIRHNASTPTKPILLVEQEASAATCRHCLPHGRLRHSRECLNSSRKSANQRKPGGVMTIVGGY